MLTIGWRELVLLRCIIVLTATGHQPTQLDAADCLNEFITRNRVPDIYGLPIQPKNASRHVQKLRAAKLINSAKQEPLSVSASGYQLNELLGYEWRRFPTLLPISEEGAPDFSHAVYNE